MSKYIIDTEAWSNLFKAQKVGIYGIGNDIVTDEKTVWSRMFRLNELEELNSDYINENFGELQGEAYQRGYDEGYKECLSENDFDQPCVSCEGYQRGLNDAWEAAKKIMNMPDPPYWDVFCEYKNELFKKLSASEAIAKLKAYEDKHSDRIEVGDEVEWTGDKYVVTYLNYNIETSEITDYDLLAYDGSVVDHVKKCAFTKTGRHFDIASILEAMRT